MKNTSIKFQELTKDELTDVSGGDWMMSVLAYAISEVYAGIEDGVARVEECC